MNVLRDNVLLESLDVVRFAADGTPLPTLEGYTGGYEGMMTRDRTGHLLAASSGHSDAFVQANGFFKGVTTQDPDWVPTGAAGAANGDVLWVFQLDNEGWFNTDWGGRRYSSTGVQEWALTYRSTTSNLLGPRGITLYDLAAGPTGGLAIAGTYHGLTFTGGILQVFAP